MKSAIRVVAALVAASAFFYQMSNPMLPIVWSDTSGWFAPFTVVIMLAMSALVYLGVAALLMRVARRGAGDGD